MTNFGNIVILQEPVRLFEATSQAKEIGRLVSKKIDKSRQEFPLIRVFRAFMVFI